MFEITANATLNGRKLHVTASGSTNAHGFTYEQQTAGGLMTVTIKLTKPTKNDPSCACSSCGCAKPNDNSALNVTLDVLPGTKRVVVTAPLEGTIASFDL